MTKERMKHPKKLEAYTSLAIRRNRTREHRFRSYNKHELCRTSRLITHLAPRSKRGNPGLVRSEDKTNAADVPAGLELVQAIQFDSMSSM